MASLRSLVRVDGPRPILSRDQIQDLASLVLGMTSVDDVSVSVRHTARSLTRLGHGRVQMADDGEDLSIGVLIGGVGGVTMSTDQIDHDVLRTLVRQCETMWRGNGGMKEAMFDTEHDTQDTYVPVVLWHDSTVEAMRTSRPTLLPALLQPLRQQKLEGYGFAGFLARAEAVMTRDKIQAYYEETDCEVSVTARTADNTGSGWGGQTDRRWEAIDPEAVTARAVDLAIKGANPKAMEPGRRTVILTRDAVAEMLRYFTFFLDERSTKAGWTPFWMQDFPNNKIGRHVLDRRINLRSDPNDPDGGYAPWFWKGYANPVMDWVQGGVLRDLAQNSPMFAVGEGKTYADDPWSLRMAGGPTSTDAMIASCKEGVYVNRFHGVDLIDGKTGLMTGTTRDGCFLVKDGKLDTPLKNFRFIDSPMFMLNNLMALGETKRASFGYLPPSSFRTPYANDYWPPDAQWPRRPMIVPPMMVRDFNFTQLADAI